MTFNLQTSSEMGVLTCPRCKRHQVIPVGYNSLDAEEYYLDCSSCGFTFLLWDFQKQAERDNLRQIYGDTQQLLSDKPLARTLKRGVTMSFREWLLWKLRRPVIVNRLLLRSGMHQVLFHSLRLAREYPAIPQAVSSFEDVVNFWTDPHHLFILEEILRWMRDTDFVAEELENSGQISTKEIRCIIETEFPKAQFGGGTPTVYAMFTPEMRGLLLATMLIRAQQNELPPLFLKIQGWVSEQYPHLSYG